MGDELSLSIEHRAEPSDGPIPIQLVAAGAALALTSEPLPTSPEPSDPNPLRPGAAHRIETALADLETVAALDDLRRACRMRTQRSAPIRD